LLRLMKNNTLNLFLSIRLDF